MGGGGTCSFFGFDVQVGMDGNRKSDKNYRGNKKGKGKHEQILPETECLRFHFVVVLVCTVDSIVKRVKSVR